MLTSLLSSGAFCGRCVRTKRHRRNAFCSHKDVTQQKRHGPTVIMLLTQSCCLAHRMRTDPLHRSRVTFNHVIYASFRQGTSWKCGIHGLQNFSWIHAQTNIISFAPISVSNVIFPNMFARRRRDQNEDRRESIVYLCRRCSHRKVRRAVLSIFRSFHTTRSAQSWRHHAVSTQSTRCARLFRGQRFGCYLSTNTGRLDDRQLDQICRCFDLVER